MSCSTLFFWLLFFLAGVLLGVLFGLSEASEMPPLFRAGLSEATGLWQAFINAVLSQMSASSLWPVPHLLAAPPGQGTATTASSSHCHCETTASVNRSLKHKVELKKSRENAIYSPMPFKKYTYDTTYFVRHLRTYVKYGIGWRS